MENNRPGQHADRLKIIIVGAGIAGLTAAYWLERGGHEITIIEKSPHLRDAGYMIDFFGDGYNVAERMDLLGELEKIHYPISQLAFLDGSGRQRFTIPYPAFRAVFDNRHFNFMRGDLERVLYGRVADSVNIRFGTTVKWLNFEGEKVRAELTDGSDETFDLVIGADGVHSKVRELVFGEESNFARFLNYYTAAFIIESSPASLGLENAWYIVTEPARQAGAYPIRGNRLATFFVYESDRRFEDLSTVQGCEELHRVYISTDWLVPEMLTECHDNIYFDEVSQIEIDGWSKGRVVLLGDACQCVSLAAGQGASLAMTGAYILSQEIGARDLASALVRYEQRIKPVIRQKQRAGRRIVKWVFPATPFRLKVRDSLARMVAWPAANWFFKRFLATRSSLIIQDA
jgi:2-polyprenyl-6-methoxyphenol hydroxylase-like FAD-dependent oxidoreductase